MLRWARLAVAWVLVTGSIAASGGAAEASDLTVATVSGAVSGITTASGNEWRGIPYAAAPIGPLRWEPPAAVDPWSGTRDASAFAPPCIQLSPDGVTGSEDCLYLNVFAPPDSEAGAQLPVMVHLHPGGNFFGEAYQNAGAFTSRGAIVVTLGYRLGVLGFMGHPELTADGHSGEFGVLDQIAALQWVHDNITAFGGDPGNVTLFGSSAGSFDAVAIVASPLSNGLVTRAAIQGIAFWPLTGTGGSTLSESEAFGLAVADGTGCSAAGDVIDCLRAVPAAPLVEEVGPGDIGGPPIGQSVLPEPPLALLAESSPPLLIGFDREEDSAFADPFREDFGTQDWVKETNAIVGFPLGRRARALYPPSDYDSLLWSAITMQTDAVHGCPTRRLANTAAAHAPVWRYLYTHVYEDDPFFAAFRAAHILEEQLLWNSDVLGFGHVMTPAEEALAARMADYWTNFAATGDPNGTGLPAWPAYDTADEPLLTLDNASQTITGYHAPQCALLDTLEEPFPAPWGPGEGPAQDPPGFLFDHARVP